MILDEKLGNTTGYGVGGSQSLNPVIAGEYLVSVYSPTSLTSYTFVPSHSVRSSVLIHLFIHLPSNLPT